MKSDNHPTRLINDLFFQQFCSRDVSLWTEKDSEKEEVAQRLDWLDAAHSGSNIIQHAETLLDDLVKEGYTHVVVLGMGGSSLAPEVFSAIFCNHDDNEKIRLDLSILDTTNPDQILEKRKELPINQTLFIVSSKSGGTAEVNALEAYFWDELLKAGVKNPGNQFIAITDPGTSLEKKGKEKGYRQVIQANPNVGGRYSALIEFGLVPAVLMGIDGKRLLEQAKRMEIDRNLPQAAAMNSGVLLGLFLTASYMNGRDKLTIITDPELKSMGSWIEQLIAESSGKNDKGILPIDLEPLHDSKFYDKDRVFVYFSKNDFHKAFIENLKKSGCPIISFNLNDSYQLGAEFLRWEIATAIACSLIGVNAFDQPNVQLSKTITQQMIVEIKKNSGRIEQEPIFSFDEINVYGEKEPLESALNITEIFNQFLMPCMPGDFVAINAFVNRNPSCFFDLQELRRVISNKTNLATTIGFGPRFLHSTGQLQKGGKNNGHYLILTADSENDMEIPGEGMSFGTLQVAQAIGDMRALQQLNRHVLRLHFKKGKFNPTLLTKMAT
jgi:transaldolase/glucose-6-phosphate isomerase